MDPVTDVPSQPTPSTSDLTSLRPARSRRTAKLALVAMVTAVCLLIGAGAAALVLVEHQQREVERVLKQLIDIQAPPNNDKLFTILSKGIGVTEWVLRTTNVGTTPAGAFATDLTSVQQSDAYTQEMLIQNTHASQNLCVKPIAWSGVTTCTALCAASGYTCSAASTDGWRLVAGQAQEFRFDGTNCVCVVGSGATTNYQSVRAVR